MVANGDAADRDIGFALAQQLIALGVIATSGPCYSVGVPPFC